MATFTNNDLKVGDIVTVRNGDLYTVVADDNGHHDVIKLTGGKPLSNGIEVGSGRLAVTGGNKKNGRDIVKVQRFDAMPARNRLSEALKTLTGHAYTEVLTVVWTEEDPKVTAAKKKVADIQEQLAKAQAALDALDA